MEIISKFQHESLLGCTRRKIYASLKIPETSIRRILAQLVALDLILEKKERQESYDYSPEAYYYQATALWGDIFGTPPEKSEDTK